MSKEEIKKNFEAGAKFTEYTINHPEILDKIPKNAKIIFVIEKESKLSKKNIELGMDIKKNEKTSVVKATQKGQKWTLEPLKV